MKLLKTTLIILIFISTFIILAFLMFLLFEYYDYELSNFKVYFLLLFNILASGKLSLMVIW